MATQEDKLFINSQISTNLPPERPYIPYTGFEQAMVDVIYGRKQFHQVIFTDLAKTEEERDVADELVKWQRNKSAVIDTFRNRKSWLDKLPYKITKILFPLANSVYPGGLDSDLETGRKTSAHLDRANEQTVNVGRHENDEE